MQVCKLFFKILKKNIFMIILYFSIFTFISIFLIQAQKTATSKQEKKIATTVVIEKENKKTADFLDFLTPYIKKVELRKGQSVSDALFWDDIDLYIFIPKNFEVKIMEGLEGIDIESSPDSLEATALLSTIRSYLNMVRESIRLGLCTEEDSFSYVSSQFNHKDEIHVEFISKESLGGIRGVFDMAVYIIGALVLSIVGIVSFELRKKDIHRRLRISSYSTGKQNIFLALCYTLFSFLFVGIVTCIALLLFPNQITVKILCYMLNAFFFAIIIVFMALFLSCLFKSDMAYSCVANVLPLGSAFLCGCFISLELLPKATKTFAHIFPQFYIVQANQYIQTASSFQFSEYLKIIWPCFIFIGLFIGGSILVSNQIAKSEN